MPQFVSGYPGQGESDQGYPSIPGNGQSPFDEGQNPFGENGKPEYNGNGEFQPG